ncbi:MAG: prepilin-type N-terminal cleavage/methylation domain-containing protein [Deltaproteobacteria bacterium]|nr:prepilin-type N-terminal cleavage/methylation domain-containing protein [Deltaproteobacteria bacterium]MBI3756328.1 prepilin-type N-terminal cleavage/methylation domain-containing protein [Deltaproteobacteria bacterium]
MQLHFRILHFKLGFTLVELLYVMIIISILAFIAVPFYCRSYRKP